MPAHLPTPAPLDPLPTAKEWLAQALGLGRINANAMALATSDQARRPSVRMVLLKELAAAGYAVFYTNYGSRKAEELNATQHAAGVLYWHELGYQLRFEGVVVRSPAEESDAYFATRPWRSRINAWSSQQSRPLDDPAELDRRVARKIAELGAGNTDSPPPEGIPRPSFWGGYRLWFEAVELWVEGENRFHERLRYERELGANDAHSFEVGSWSRQRLQP